MSLISRIRCVLIFALLYHAGTVGATHLRAAEIIVERVPNSLVEFRITLTAYLDLKSTTRFGNNSNAHVDFGDGNRVVVTSAAATPRPDLGPDIGTASFVVNHVYAIPGVYRITYFERDRSNGVLNIPNSGDTPFSTYTEINTDPKFGLNSFPELIIRPVDRTCPGVTFFHNPGARDTEGDSLSYELTTPLGYPNNLPQYISPDAQQFYADYSTGNEDDNGPPSFAIDSETGLIIWNAPGLIGEYNIAFKIIEWRKNVVTNTFDKLSTTVRDMQIIVEDCVNGRPDLISPGDLCVEAGTSIQAAIIASDPDNDHVKIEAVSEIFDFTSDAATLLPLPAFTPPPSTQDFEWNTNCSHVREQPYQVVFKVSDKPRFGTTLVTFKTWSIRILAPAPTGLSTSLDLVSRKSILRWDPYACTGAEKIQIWRKVGSFELNQTPCNPGNPELVGYELIDVVSSSETMYGDNNSGIGLVAGARYCYRIVAVFKAPAGGKSYVSDETCVGPIKADAPVMTHVTVQKTSTRDGVIKVSWRSPFEIDKQLFPQPFQYDVYRSEGFTGSWPKEKIAHVQDTVFFDSGINTTDKIYNYTIVVYSRPSSVGSFIPVDTSATASSVRLEATPGVEKISLRWHMEVPWSTIIEELPWHRIYRGVSENTLMLIDSVNVSERDFVFEDSGLESNTRYYYRVETVGSYGNAAIGILKNTSQTVALYPTNTLLPCAPKVTVIPIDCEEFLNSEETCERTDLTSTIFWSPSFENGCRIDIKSYNVYALGSKEGEFTFIANVADTFYTEPSLSSLARCYRVSAVDALGQTSELSEVVCNENCPYYELPNVFTPDNNGDNDLFSAYYKPSDGSNGKKYNNVNRCPRFVERVDLTVYSRWGREVYNYSSDGGGSIYIDWNGKNNSGTELEAGVYYYVADVVFKTIDASKRNKTLKGWVQLVR